MSNDRSHRALAVTRSAQTHSDLPSAIGGFDGDEHHQNQLRRRVAAIRRYKWLIAAIVFVASLAGFVGTRLVTPKYEVRATIWIESTPRGENRYGPIRAGELLSSNAWIELFRSYRIVDEVVRKLALYLQPNSPADAPVFAGFELADRFLPGSYELTLNGGNRGWVLRNELGADIARGGASDSVGNNVGFRWALASGAFPASGTRTVSFTVATPRETSIRLLDRLTPRMALGSNFLWLTYQDIDSKRAALILNTWVDEFVTVAADLKKRNLVEFATILEEQLQYAERATQEAEAAYQGFRVNTITLPTEGGPVAAGAGGQSQDRDPALLSFFEQKIEYDNLRHDREALEKTLANAATTNAPYEGLLLIPSVAQSPGAEALREAFRTQYQLEARLRAERQKFTDEFPTVKDLIGSLDVLRKQTIPSLANQLLAQLSEREMDYQRRIQAASRELQQIPPRTIEERRLHRAVVVSEGLYTNLKARYAEAKLSEASATPDLSVLDTAIAPLSPTKNTAPMMMLAALAGGLGLAIVLAIFLDQIDRRFRYPEQASELGLMVAGTVPRIPKGGTDAQKPEQVVQLVESFRTLRMHVLHGAEPNEPITLAVTSAAPGDGKSLVSSNLALSFAEAGLRTLLMDGDTRRGTLHRMFDLKLGGGLTDYLMGTASEADIVRPTPYEKLFIVSSGQRDRRSPEMLTSPRLGQLIQHLSSKFDIIVIDTPPLAAGVDGYAISAAARRVLMVVRMGETERKLAAMKLSILDRLPVDILGAVLNSVQLTGEFEYYAYSSGYGAGVNDSNASLVGVGRE